MDSNKDILKRLPRVPGHPEDVKLATKMTTGLEPPESLENPTEFEENILENASEDISAMLTKIQIQKVGSTLVYKFRPLLKTILFRYII